MSKNPRVERLSRLHARAAASQRTDGVRAAAGDEQASESAGATSRSAELWLYGVVGGWWFGFDADDVARQLRGLDVDEIQVRLHSPGGSAWEGIAISNLLANHPARVTVVVDGLAASAASVIALGGDEVVMSPGAQMMIHDASILTYGNAAQLREDADWVDNQSENYAEIYAHRAGGNAEQWREVMRAETWYSAQQAVEAGLAARVGNVTSLGAPPAAPEVADGDEDDASARAAWDLEVLVHPAARAAWSGPRGTKPPSASAVGSTPTHEGSPAVAFTTEQLTTMRTQLGVAEDADEATILAALTEALDERADESTTTTTRDVPGAATSASTAPEGYTLVSDVELATLRTGAADGSRAAQTLHERDREAFLDANRAKIPTALRASWAAQYDRDPAATRTSLAAMADIVPTAELGHNAEDDDSTPTGITAITESEAYKNWSM